jgi:hypothetical protein
VLLAPQRRAGRGRGDGGPAHAQCRRRRREQQRRKRQRRKPQQQARAHSRRSSRLRSGSTPATKVLHSPPPLQQRSDVGVCVAALPPQLPLTQPDVVALLTLAALDGGVAGGAWPPPEWIKVCLLCCAVLCCAVLRCAVLCRSAPSFSHLAIKLTLCRAVLPLSKSFLYKTFEDFLQKSYL